MAKYVQIFDLLPLVKRLSVMVVAHDLRGKRQAQLPRLSPARWMDDASYEVI